MLKFLYKTDHREIDGKRCSEFEHFQSFDALTAAHVFVFWEKQEKASKGHLAWVCQSGRDFKCKYKYGRTNVSACER